MSSQATSTVRRRDQWLVLTAAFLGWMFDGFEMGLFPLIGVPALTDLLGPNSPASQAAQWFGAIIAVFLVGAATGGVLFGWLGDKIGRVKAMSLSIFTYAILSAPRHIHRFPRRVVSLLATTLVFTTGWLNRSALNRSAVPSWQLTTRDV